MSGLKKILITGCRGGFGHDSAFELAKRGHKVWATTKTEEDAQRLNQEFRENGLSANSFKLDVTDKKDYERINELDLDVLINNAATGESGPLSEIDVNKVRNNFEVNLFSPLELSQLVLDKMIKKDSGRVIFISSLAGRISIPFLAPYSMTKFAISSGAEAMRAEIKRITNNVFVSVVEPGAFYTGFNQKVRSKKYEWLSNASNYRDIIDELKREDNTFYKYEAQNIDPVVKKIVKATEDSNPRFRYTAPWWQGLGVWILRVLGR